MTTIARTITGGVDTHLDVHVAAALDERGALLGVESFPTTSAGYRQLLSWLEGFGTLELVGIEGTGSYGAGLTRHLQSNDVRVVEVDRPTASAGAAGASPIPKTPSRQLEPPRAVRQPGSRRRGTATSNRCACCE